jgi:hypothetical protein
MINERSEVAHGPLLLTTSLSIFWKIANMGIKAAAKVKLKNRGSACYLLHDGFLHVLRT